MVPLPPPELTTGGTLGSVDLGARGTDTSGDVARLERYRDIDSGAFGRLLFRKDTDQYLFQAGAFNIGAQDQRYQAQYNGKGIRFSGMFDSIPTNYTFLSSSPWVQQTPDVFTLDLAARQQVQNKQVVGIPQNPNDLNSASIYRGLANPFDLQSLRQTTSTSVAYDFSNTLGFDATFSNIKRSGQQPIGASFAFNVANEVPMTLDNHTNDLSAGLEWTRPKGMFRIGWNGSWFDNNVTELVWDNPYRATDQNPYDGSAYVNGNGSSRGRLALPPSNNLNSVSAFGLYKLPSHTTVNGSLAFTRMSQDNALIPWTINPVLQTPSVYAQYPGLAALPRPTAEALVHGVNGFVNFTTRPANLFGLTARYRYNDHTSLTPIFDGTQYVVVDGAPESRGFPSQQFNIRQNTLDLDGTLYVVKYTAIRVGYTYDDYSRTGREFNDTTENIFRTSADVIGNQFVTVRGMFQHGQRTGSGFGSDIIEEGGYQPGLRFYDEADRDRNAGTVLFTVTATSTVDVTFSVTAGKDTYSGPGHDFGLLDNTNTTYNIGIDFTPRPGVSVGGNYGRQHFATNQKSRQANPPPDPTFTDPNRDWSLANTENDNNFTLFVDLPKIARQTNLRFTYDLSDSDNGFLFSGPNIARLASLTPSQFIPVPNVTNKWQRFAADAQYFFTGRIGIGLTYWFEKLDETDFAAIDLPGQPGAPRIDYLGEISAGYGPRPAKANTFFVRLLYLY
jgi:MtrB/PioB family decaheme-associated outer membrane protein